MSETTTYNLSAIDRAAAVAQHFHEKAHELAEAGDFEAAYKASHTEATVAGGVIVHFMDRAEWPEEGLPEDEQFEGDPEDVSVDELMHELTVPEWLQSLFKMLEEEAGEGSEPVAVVE